jgi:release factor glutamine methyltransferase
VTLAELLQQGACDLRDAGVPDPQRDARVLLCHVVQLETAQLVSRSDENVGDAAQRDFARLIEKRARRQPVAQIIGVREFWGREFAVTRDTLDPRPESETIVSLALAQGFGRVLDLGTGTGILALTLLCEVKTACAVASDISSAALDVARSNAQRLGCDARISFVQSDWWRSVEGRFDLIVCNPPYIPETDKDHLDLDVRDWEPHGALFAGSDGLAAYRAIATGMAGHLDQDGRAFFEFGRGQGQQVLMIFKEAGFADVTLHSDMGGVERVLQVSR